VFYQIHRLKKGDLIQLVSQDDALFTYRVVEVDKVSLQSDPSATVLEHIAHVAQTRDETLTLITCGGANLAPFPSRIYVTAKRVPDE
jgi:LPXTG-site transpeptidase (sortase) family protein